MAESQIHGPGLFRGLLCAQGLATLVVAVLAAWPGGRDVALAGLIGGGIATVASGWAGFQLWLHPGNRQADRAATAAIRAEIGRVVIVLLLLWLTLKHWPEARQGATAMMLFAGFFVVQLVGWIWLARATGETNVDSNRNG
ncbi:MAG: ATP synthase subunit I [Alcanivoracaceae bacterium]|nr:ATP synthase subunit I [Alcanivoracaceae bacterium]